MPAERGRPRTSGWASWWTLTMAACTALAGGCFERECADGQELRGELRICVCKEGTVLDESDRCVPIPSSPPPTDAGSSEADAGSPMSGDPTCDEATGLGCPCTGDFDCAGKKADYCIVPDPNDPEGKRACLYQGCDQPGEECPEGLQCCSFFLAPEGTVCLPAETKCPFD